MALNVSAYTNILKTDYQGPIIDQLENTTAFLSRMERREEETGGNFLYMPLRTGRTASIGARNDGASEMLPTGATPKYGNATYAVKGLYATMRITGKVMRASRNPTLAFAKAQVRDMEDTVKDLKKDINRQLFADGSAELCQVASGTSNTITVTSHLYPSKPTKFLYDDEIVDIRTFADGTIVSNGDSITVASVPSSTTWTYSGTEFTEASTQGVYREDNAATSEIKEVNGLYGIVDDENPDSIWTGGTDRISADIGAVDRSSVSYWKAQILHNNGTDRPFALAYIEQGMDDVEVNGGGEVTIIQTNHSIKRVYGLQMATIKGADVGVMELDGGFKYLKVNEVPMVWDTECPDNTIFLLDEDTLALGVQGPWQWLENNANGDVLTRLPRQDQYEAVMVRECNLMCSKPANNCKIEDIAHS